ncbi:immunoglobulin-like domain-containing protein [Enterococcus faecalis]|uniref:immunoglobulin-like domain-containing protein n=1 Tax=Enterococcus faecalis TaxID=1351 RepID=UPI001D1739AD|nr:immunoglobulin-like domain-containing protein [Enterococcus faecalis]MCC4084485.1 hypothetical protein [Enterococcus faecalis]
MSVILPEKFRLYKKGETNPVAEGISPLAITGLTANTDVLAGNYTVTGIATVNGEEKESVPIAIPAFKTGLITPDVYSIGSDYVTGKYEGILPTKIALIVNDEKQQTVKLSEELTSKKQFRYYKQGLEASDRVKVVLYDESLELGTSDVVIQSAYSMNMTANEMKAKLDEKNIEYKTSDTKETLLSLLQKN